MKIEFREALTVKQGVGRKSPAGATILMLFPKLTADSRSPDIPHSLEKRRENGRNVTSFRAWPLWPATWVGYELGGSAPHQCR